MDPNKEGVNIAPEHQRIADSIAKGRDMGETGEEALKRGLENRYGEQKAKEIMNQMTESSNQSSGQAENQQEEKKAA